MPLHTYECSICGKHEDKVVKFAEADHMQICDCRLEYTMTRVECLSAPVLQFKGRWFKTAGSY